MNLTEYPRGTGFPHIIYLILEQFVIENGQNRIINFLKISTCICIVGPGKILYRTSYIRLLEAGHVLNGATERNQIWSQ